MNDQTDKEILEIQKQIRQGNDRQVNYLFSDFIEKHKGRILYFIGAFTSLNYVDKDVFYNVACHVLYEKIQTFDPNMSACFWTYVKPAIRYEAMRTVDAEYNIIQIPYYQRVEAEKLRKKARALGYDLTQMSIDDMEYYLDVDKEKIEILLPYIRRKYLYSTELDDSEQEELFIENETEYTENSICDFFYVLTEQEEELMRMRYGLPPYEHEHKLKEIKAKHGIDIPRLSVLLKKCRAKLSAEYLQHNQKESE